MNENNVIELNSTNFDDVVLKSATPVLVDFWASWCMPCRMQSSAVDELAEELKGKAIVAKVNVDECEDLAVKFNVNAIPYLAVFKNGVIVEDKVGLSTKEELLKIILKNA